jgi:hypothetical protein
MKGAQKRAKDEKIAAWWDEAEDNTTDGKGKTETNVYFRAISAKLNFRIGRLLKRKCLTKIFTSIWMSQEIW